MLNLATMLALLLVAVFGGGATMVAAAQSAQPEDVLYPVKTWSEDLRMGLTSNTQDKLELQLQYSARRMDEVQHGLATGTGVSSLLLTRYQNQLQEQLRLVVGLPDELAAAGLAQIRTHAREQEQAMAQLQLQDPAASQIRDSVRMMLRTQEQLAQTGMNDPDWLRQQIRMRSRIRLAAPTAQETPATQTAVDSGNPWTTAVPTPGSSYGPGTSQNPWTDTTPTPESGYGPGPGTKGCPNCPGPSGNGGSSAQPGSAGNNGP